MPLLMKRHSVLPGFGLAAGYTLLYLCLIVLIPLAAMALRAAQMPIGDIWKLLTDPRVIAACKLSFGASFAADFLNMMFGLLVAWVLARYSFPGKRIVDALVVCFVVRHKCAPTLERHTRNGALRRLSC